MNQLLFKKSESESYLYNNKESRIHVIPKRKFKNVRVGIIIDAALKIPPDTGVTYRLYYLSKELAQRGINVKIFLCNRNFENEEKIKNLFKEPRLEFHIIPEYLFYNAKRLNEIIKSNPVDILQVEDPVDTLRYQQIVRNLNIPFCLEMHDVETSLLELLNWDSKEVNLREAISYFACAVAEKVICMTPLDYNELVYKIGVDINKLTLIPNPIDLEEFPYYGPSPKTKNIIFLGNMFYWPNQNAAKFIAKKIYPKINKKFNEIKFTLIGMVPKNIKRALEKDNFIFTNSVTGIDLNRMLKESTIALCPVTEGSGMKVKILNYCAAGLPVITTTVGASGYEKVKSLIIENDPNKYAKIIMDLLNHPGKMKILGKRNRIAIKKYYDLDKIADKTIQVYQEILNNLYYKTKQIKVGKVLKLPLPIWLREKRVKKIKNKNYYKIKNGKIVFKKEIDKFT